MPPIFEAHTAYTDVKTTSAQTAIPIDLAGLSNRSSLLDNSPRLGSGTLVRRHRPLQLLKFPLLTTQNQRAGSNGTRHTQKRSGASLSTRVEFPQHFVPTITAEHNPNPPPLYSPSIALHASIVPYLPDAGTPNKPGSRAALSTPDIAMIVAAVLLSVVFIVILAAIYRIRQGLPFKDQNNLPDAVTVRKVVSDVSSSSRNDGDIGNTVWSNKEPVPGTEESIESFEELEKQSDEKGVPIQSPLIKRSSTALFIISMSDSAGSSSCTHSDESIGPRDEILSPSAYALSNEIFQERLKDKEVDLDRALTHATVGREIPQAPDDWSLRSACEIEDSTDVNDHLASKPEELDETSPSGIPIAAEPGCCPPHVNDTSMVDESWHEEKRHTQILETEKADLLRHPVFPTKTGLNEDASLPPTTDVIVQETPSSPLSNGSTSENTMASLITEFPEDRLALLPCAPPSLVITQPSSTNIFGLHSSLSTVTIDLSEFPAPPAAPPVPRVEVTLPQVELDFPVYIWDEDSDMLTVHRNRAVLDQFISLYS